MAEIKLGGSISLVGFDVLEPAELIVVKKLVGNFVRKLSNQANYNSLRLELRMHKKGKAFLHEVTARAEINGNNLGTNINDYNLYSCLNKVSEKMLSEVVHKKRLQKDAGQEMIRKQEKERRKEKAEEEEKL